MPFIQVKTIQQVATAIEAGAQIAIPTYQQQRGHPIGFSQQLYDELALLSGDEGARSVIKKHEQAVDYLTCDDMGILQDIDTQADLVRLAVS
jgi:molybdenum cofactor cytidylyltransferase